MEYLNRHKKNTLRFEPWYISKLQKGMIISAKYTTLKGDTKEYYLLILNPKYRDLKAKNKDWKVHALNLNYFPPELFYKMADDTGIKYLLNLQRWRGLDLVHQIQEQSSRRFYHSDVKKIIKRHNPYRTMFLDKFSSVKIIDYKFPEYLEEKYLRPLEVMEKESNTKFRHDTKRPE